MRRRDILMLLGGAVALSPALALGQQPDGIPSVGVLIWPDASPDSARRIAEPLRRGLAEAGYVDGRSIRLVYRFGGRDMDRAIAAARELEALGAAVIVAASTPAVVAAKRADLRTPIVMASAADPVGSGLVDSLAHPGGNITGMSFSGPELAGKRLQLLREVIPGLDRVALLALKADPAAALFDRETREAAQQMGIAFHAVQIATDTELREAFAAFRDFGARALIVQPIFVSQRDAVAGLAREFRLPWISDFREFAEAGAPLSYGADLGDIFFRAGRFYVDRILKGAKPADLPIQQPTVFEFVVNLTAARAFGLVLPDAILGRADAVID